MNLRFQNQVVWITGASSGIGRELALEFAREGARLALSARRQAELETLAEQIRVLGSEALVLPCDVCSEQAQEQAMQHILKQYGQLDVAVANAGFGVVGQIETLTQDEWERQFAVNVVGLALTARAAIPALRQSKGRLALVGSVAAFVPTPATGAYGASKAAVRSIGQTLSMELQGSGVSCTTLHPGFVNSDIARVDNHGVLHPHRKDPRPAQLMWPTHQAARVMLRAIHRRKGQYVFTGHGRFIVFLSRFFPALLRRLLRKMMT
jgi:short-subunit dehydrogenase